MYSNFKGWNFKYSCQRCRSEKVWNQIKIWKTYIPANSTSYSIQNRAVGRWAPAPPPPPPPLVVVFDKYYFFLLSWVNDPHPFLFNPTIGTTPPPPPPPSFSEVYLWPCKTEKWIFLLFLNGLRILWFMSWFGPAMLDLIRKHFDGGKKNIVKVVQYSLWKCFIYSINYHRTTGKYFHWWRTNVE